MRRLVVLFLTLLIAVSSPLAIRAQDATPNAMGPSMLSQMGLPELRITLGTEGVQIPSEVPAGETLVVVENTLEFPSGLIFVQLPEGATIEEAMQILGPPPGAEGPPDVASPQADMVASPEAGGGEEMMGPPPPLFYDMTWGGGVFSMPGMPAEIVLNLAPGEWFAVSDLPEAAPVAFQVTGDATDATGAIIADAQIELKDYQVVLPQQLLSGQQIWEVSNTGEQPHELFITKTPRLLTLEEVDVLLALPEDELPPEGFPNPAEFQDVGGIAPFSQDQTVYVELNLEPGAYVAICFMPSKDTGEPHAMKGMVVVFEIGEDGAVVSPPSSPEPQEDHGHDMATPES